MKHLILLTTGFWLMASLSAFSITPSLRWNVTTERLSQQPLEIRRGESINLEPAFSSYGSNTDLTAASNVVFRYVPSTLSTSTWYYAITGSVISATGGLVRFHWTPSAEATNSAYRYEIALGSTNATNLRAYGTLKLLPGIASAGSTSGAPTRLTLLDWAAIENQNTASAPFGAGAGSDTNMSNRVTQVENTVSNLNLNTITARGNSTTNDITVYHLNARDLTIPGSDPDYDTITLIGSATQNEANLTASLTILPGSTTSNAATLGQLNTATQSIGLIESSLSNLLQVAVLTGSSASFADVTADGLSKLDQLHVGYLEVTNGNINLHGRNLTNATLTGVVADSLIITNRLRFARTGIDNDPVDFGFNDALFGFEPKYDGSTCYMVVAPGTSNEHAVNVGQLNAVSNIAAWASNAVGSAAGTTNLLRIDGSNSMTGPLNLNGQPVTNAGNVHCGNLFAETVWFTNKTIWMNPPWTNSGGPGDQNCYLASDGANFFQFGVNTNNWLAKLRCGSATNVNEAVTLGQSTAGVSSGTVLMVNSATGFAASPLTSSNLNLGAITSGGLVGDRRINIGTNNAGWFAEGGSGLTVGQNNLCRKLSLASGEDCQAYGKYSASFGKGNYSEGDHSFSAGRNGGAYAPGAMSMNGIVNAGADDGMGLRGGVVAANMVRGFAVGSSATVTNSDAHVMAHWGYGADLGSFGAYSLGLGYSGGIYLMGSNRVVVDSQLFVQGYNYGILTSNAYYLCTNYATLSNTLATLPKVALDPINNAVTIALTNAVYTPSTSLGIFGFDYPVTIIGVQGAVSATAESTNQTSQIEGTSLSANLINVNACKGLVTFRYLNLRGNSSGGYSAVSAMSSSMVDVRNCWVRGNSTSAGSCVANVGASRLRVMDCALSDANVGVTCSGGNTGLVDTRVTNTVPVYGIYTTVSGAAYSNAANHMAGSTAVLLKDNTFVQ